MALDYHKIKNWQFDEVRHRYQAQDVIRYALGIGLGHDPMDKGQLQYVYERDLKVFPTMGAVLGYPGFWMKDPRAGITWVQLVHGEQRMQFHAPFPVQGEVIGRSHISHVIDKGEKGALVVTRRTVHDARNEQLLATVDQVTFCRADGGFGTSDAPPAPLPGVPARAPDHVCVLPTAASAALLYRLSGDDNPLHADPDVAAKAGFPRPILHGLCTYGVAAHAIVRTLCDYDASRLTHLHARFSAPVYPGETLSVDLWREPGGDIAFQARVLERDILVLSHGRAGVSS